MNGRRIGLIVLVLLPIALGIFLAADPLNRLVARLELAQLAGAKWQNGFWTPIDLPGVATVPNLVDRLAGADLYQVIESRPIWTVGGARSSKCVAALVDTPDGRKICLFRYVPWTDSWEARIYPL